MELNTVRRVFSVLDRHDFMTFSRGISPSDYLKFVRKCVRFDDQTVVSRRNHWVGDTLENPLLVVVDVIRLAMHQAVGADNFTTGGRAD